jgi:hypothetical protein
VGDGLAHQRGRGCPVAQRGRDACAPQQHDVPFRRIAAAVNGTQWSYPRSIPRQVLLAHAAGGIDSARTVFRALTAEAVARPGSFTLWPQTLRAAAEEIAQAGKLVDAAEILRWCRERWPAEAACTAPLPEAGGGRCADGQPAASAAHLRPLMYRCRGAGERNDARLSVLTGTGDDAAPVRCAPAVAVDVRIVGCATHHLLPDFSRAGYRRHDEGKHSQHDESSAQDLAFHGILRCD